MSTSETPSDSGSGQARKQESFEAQAVLRNFILNDNVGEDGSRDLWAECDLNFTSPRTFKTDKDKAFGERPIHCIIRPSSDAADGRLRIGTGKGELNFHAGFNYEGQPFPDRYSVVLILPPAGFKQLWDYHNSARIPKVSALLTLKGSVDSNDWRVVWKARDDSPLAVTTLRLGYQWGETNTLADLNLIREEWLGCETREIEKPTWGKAQFVRLLEVLSLSALEHSQRQGLDQFNFERRLADIEDLLHDVQWTVKGPDEDIWINADDNQTEKANSKKDGNGDSDQNEEHEIDKKRRGEVWVGGDLVRAFQEGTKSEYASKIDRHSLSDTTAKYLSQPWLQCAELEQIIVAAFVYDETFSYGEEIKKKAPGPRHPVFGWLMGGDDSWAYWRADGKIDSMFWFNLKWSLGRFAIKLGIFLGLPIAVGVLAWNRGHTDETLIGGALYGGIMLIWLTYKFLRGAFGISSKEKAAEYKKVTEVWGAMCQAYMEINGVVVSPTRVREALSEAAKKGAIWDSAVWAVLDYAILRNPAVWSDDSGLIGEAS